VSRTTDCGARSGEAVAASRLAQRPAVLHPPPSARAINIDHAE
jgi:hypothetical protein